MSAKTTTTPIRKLPLFTPYVIIWSMLGSLACGLLAVLGLAPEWLNDFRPGAVFSVQHGDQGSRITARLATDIEQLKMNVGQLGTELAQVRSDVVAQGEQQKVATSQISALASRLAAVMESSSTDANSKAAETEAVARKETEKAGARPSRDPAQTAAKAPNTSEIPKPPARKPRVINTEAGDANTDLETGSLPKQESAADPIAFGPAVVKRVPEKIGLKLTSGPSVDSLRLSWALISDIQADKLSKLEPRYTSSGSPGNPQYDLVVGPVKSKSEAAKLCKSLANQGIACSVGTYTGNAL